MAPAVRLGVGVAWLAGAAVAVAAHPADSTPSRRLEGSWVRLDLAGSESFDHLTSGFKPAELTPDAEARAPESSGPRRWQPTSTGGPNPAGVAYIAVVKPCSNSPRRSNGALLLNPDSGGVHFIEQRDEVVFAGERGGVRHIYVDGRPHPPHWDPTPAGHSVGHYEGHVLVVETVGMMAGSVVAGGMRTPETKLTERFEVSEDGRRLTITYTWEDPAIYRRPHTYQYFMERLPAGSYALEEWCDASDPLEQQSIVPPEQLE